MAARPQDPIDQAEEAVQNFSDLVDMQSVKETVQGAVQKVAEVVWEGSKQEEGGAAAASAGAGTAEQAQEEEGQPAQEPDRDVGHLAWKGAPGPLERMKESAVHAVEGVKLRLHLAGHGSGGQQGTAEQRTGESMHMAKAAEGRNEAQDDPIDHALHEALKPDPGEKPETSDFPETLGDALAAAQMRDLPQGPPKPAAAALSEAERSGVEPAPANPFSALARSKL